MTDHFDPRASRTLYKQQLKPVFEKYPPVIELDERNEFYLRLLAQQGLLGSGKHLVDLGAGLSVFGPICQAHGMHVTLVDDFGGGGGVELGQHIEDIPLLDVFEKQFG